MNYLAHIHLSGEDEDLMIGNFIADSIKNMPLDYFETGVQRGILLHRHIDEFTDSHLIFKRSKGRLFEKYRHYAAVLVDMFYDHMLAANWKDYADIPLSVYSRSRYKMLNDRVEDLQPKAKQFLSYIISRDTLNNYQYLEEFDMVLKHLSTRTKYVSNFSTAILDLKANYDDFQDDFMSFYPLLQASVRNYLINN